MVLFEIILNDWRGVSVAEVKECMLLFLSVSVFTEMCSEGIKVTLPWQGLIVGLWEGRSHQDYTH